MNPPPTPLVPSAPPAGSFATDLLVYAGRLLETPSGLAQAVLDYAHAVAQRGTSDVVTVPVLHDGQPHEVRLLVGGAVPLAALSPAEARTREQAQADLDALRSRVSSSPRISDGNGSEDDDYWQTAAYSEWEY
ncbi:hypothetical protein [Naasia sp. SYSU D00948]|uniref:hypothetical protein n=1 Tax=Naasia sp. SYSU D00948 TaxID=2817379 RepID=UPI001B30D748|nr:hypothetical protein [Naasia sp. SYSU D00948]